MNKAKDKIIKMLGGFTNEEYSAVRKERDLYKKKYKVMLDSKTDSTAAMIANEYIFKLLQTFRHYAKFVLYGLDGNVWAKKMFNVIDNNYLNMAINYFKSESVMPYVVDTSLDKDDEVLKIIKAERTYDEIDYITDNILETD